MPSRGTTAPRGARAVRAACAMAVLWVSGSTACIIDDADRCSANQVLDDGLCRCVEDSTLIGNACVASVLDAAVDASTPASDAARDGDGASGLGTACGSSAACTDPAYPTCQAAPSGERTCTKSGCTSASDCPSGYVCSGSGATSYCRRPYTGQGTACQSAANCTGDALFCSGLLRTCLVRDCTDTSCDPGYSCFHAGDFMPGQPNVCVMSGLLDR